MKSITNAQTIAPIIIEARYIIVLRIPISCRKIIREAIFVAGPAMSKTNAAPGETPLIISDSAMGIEPVAHIYIGADIKRMSAILRK